jgi:hypothetical protein
VLFWELSDSSFLIYKGGAMKVIIQEYGKTVIAMVTTGIFFFVISGLLFQRDGMLVRLMDVVLGGGV